MSNSAEFEQENIGFPSLKSIPCRGRKMAPRNVSTSTSHRTDRKRKRETSRSPKTVEPVSPLKMLHQVRKYMKLRGEMAATLDLLSQQDEQCSKLLKAFQRASLQETLSPARLNALYGLEQQLMVDRRDDRATEVWKQNHSTINQLIKFIQPKLTGFPDELLAEMMLYLDFASQQRLRRVSQRFRYLLRQPEFGIHLNFYGVSLFGTPHWFALKKERSQVRSGGKGYKSKFPVNFDAVRTVIFHNDPADISFGKSLLPVDPTPQFIRQLTDMFSRLTSVHLVGLKILSLLEYQRFAEKLLYTEGYASVAPHYWTRTERDFQLVLVNCYVSAWPMPKITEGYSAKGKAASVTGQGLLTLYRGPVHAYVPVADIMGTGERLEKLVLRKAKKDLAGLLWPFRPNDHKIEEWLADNVHHLNGNKALLALLEGVSEWINPLNKRLSNNLLCPVHQEFCGGCDDSDKYEDMDGSLCHLLVDCLLHLNSPDVPPPPRRFRFDRK